MRGALLLWLIVGCTGNPVVDETDTDVDTDTDTDPDTDTDCIERSVFADVDADGHGDPGTERRDCGPASGEVELGDDCDDSEPTVHPGAVEVCGDGLDNDCEPGVLECRSEGDVSVDTVASSVQAANAGDGFGTVLGLSTEGLLVGAPSHDLRVQNGGAVSVFLGPASDLSTATRYTITTNETDANLGTGVAWVGDVTGDGEVDLVVGATGSQAASQDAGVAYLIAGPVTGDVDVDDAVASIYGSRKDRVGGAAAAADWDDDAATELLIGVPELDGSTGRVVWLDDPSGNVGAQSVDDAFVGSGSLQRVGTLVSNVGDLDGDGIDEVVIGASDTANASAVELYVHGAAPTGEADLTSGAVAWLSSAELANDVGTVAGADMDGDGYTDLVLGAPSQLSVEANAGRACVIGGPVTGAVGLDDARGCLAGADPFQNLGTRVTATDLDDDGLADLIAADADGVVFLVYGGPEGAVDLADARITAPGNGIGMSVVSGDLSGDGIGDLVIGVSGGLSGSGTAWLLLGRGI